MKISRKSPLPKIASLFLAFALSAQAQTKAPSCGLIRRVDKPVCVKVPDGNQTMDRAVRTAQKTVGKFLAVLRSPKGNQSRFAVKKPFVEGDKVEHLWVSDVTFDGRHFHGKVDNEPLEIKGVSPGQKITAAPNQISDWMYVQDGRLVGGYTIHAMCKNMSAAEKRQFEEDSHCHVR